MAFDRQAAAAWYRRNRERSRALFDLLTDETYYSRPISLRHPIVFYEGHLPGFSFNTLVKKGLGRPSIDARLETLFARGIDPHEGKAEEGKAGRQGDIDRPGHPVLDRAEAAFTILEHEVMRYSAFRFGPRPKTTVNAETAELAEQDLPLESDAG